MVHLAHCAAASLMWVKLRDTLGARTIPSGSAPLGTPVSALGIIAINGEPARSLKAGETFYEPPTAVHSTSRNPSTDKRAKILVFMVADQKNPSTVPE